MTNLNRIIVKDLVKGASTNSDAVVLFYTLEKYLQNKKRVSVSLEGLSAISSSFFNSSFKALIDTYGFEDFKKYVDIKNCSRSNLKLLQRYFQDYRSYQS